VVKVVVTPAVIVAGEIAATVTVCPISAALVMLQKVSIAPSVTPVVGRLRVVVAPGWPVNITAFCWAVRLIVPVGDVPMFK
jgi:hypothetical protein